ncbi:MAG: hypothetical protein V4584_12925 [Verrucomicrobiota bacterium]
MKNRTASQNQVDLYETTNPLLEAMYREMQELSKKKPEATLSSAKVKLLNRLLEDLRLVLANESGLKYLDLIDDEALPQYSDVVLMLSQYDAAMKSFFQLYYGYDSLKQTHGWAIEKPLPKKTLKR